MKLLCDEMLKGLARWLRVAGYDTEIAHDGENDRSLIERARQSGRLLLTRDRKLLEFRHAKQTVRLLHCSGIDECARSVKQQLAIDWLHKPFSRCLLCNNKLHSVGSQQQELRNRVPPDVRHGPLLTCPRCQRLYWPGSHVRRMQARLDTWAEQD
jgi:uncharacterized protein with PIN domain